MTTHAPGRLLWEPTVADIERATLTRFQHWVEARHGLAFTSYAELWAWSVTEVDAFWLALWDFCEVGARAGRALESHAMPGTTWFPGTHLNYAELIFRGRPDDRIAAIHASELRPLTETTWRELRELTAAVAEGLRALGVSRGDRVAAYLPNVVEATAALLATAGIGAIWSSCSPDFGARSVIDRFAQIEPKVLLTVDGYRYGGKDFRRHETVAAVQAAIPSLEATVVLPYLDPGGVLPPGSTRWSDLLDNSAPAVPAFADVAFDHPLWVLYTSGTTGLPKALVHGHGGIALEHLKKARLHLDLREGDRFFWFSTTGWMMWNFLIGGLLADATIVLYDGSPGAPTMDVLWDLAADAGITAFGTSAAYITACMKAGVEPAAGRDLSRLRGVGSTGSPLSPDGFRWIYEHVGSDTWLFSTSGGTDLCTAFVGGVPTLPVYEGELQARSLGAKVEAYDPEGRSLVDEVGELVLTEPMPSMPLRLWGDEDGSRYEESYFSTYPGVWRHGDWIEITSRGTAVIYGRSDSTVNRGGIRMGTSEIYSAVLAVPEIVDALVVDVPRDDAEAWMPLFVVLREDAVLDDRVVAEIRARIRADCSPRHVPDDVIEIAEVPRTLSGKILEIPVKRILMGHPPDQVASRDSLANPSALDAFVEMVAR